MTGKQYGLYIGGLVFTLSAVIGANAGVTITSNKMESIQSSYIRSAEFKQACETAEAKLKVLETEITSKEYQDFKAHYESDDFVKESLKQSDLYTAYKKAENWNTACRTLFQIFAMAEGSVFMLPAIFDRSNKIKELQPITVTNADEDEDDEM